MTAGTGSRDDRRRRTEAAILAAAQELFAEVGFERTTIRAVAARAGVDPALVMQYYGSKEQLFGAAAKWDDLGTRSLSAPPGKLAEAALADFFFLEDSDDRDALIALMRNCLTHPGAGAAMRDQVVCDRAEKVAETLDGPDALLRATLVSACLMGLGMSRYLLAVEPVASASREDLERLLAPALRALVEPPAT